MKTLNKLSILTLTSVLFLTSCETTELDLTSNPNALSPEQASADLFINATFKRILLVLLMVWVILGRLTRVAHMVFDRLYRDNYGPGSLGWFMVKCISRNDGGY